MHRSAGTRPHEPCATTTRCHVRWMTNAAPDDTIDLAALVPDCQGLIGDIRSDHASETGAVMIYRGILAGARDPAIRRFATAHMATEQRHLDLLGVLLPSDQRSALLPIWRISGWLTGFVPALIGPRAVYPTIDAVETFVDHHYEAQIQKLARFGPAGLLRATLLACQADEVHHRDEARTMRTAPAGFALAAWQWAARQPSGLRGGSDYG